MRFCKLVENKKVLLIATGLVKSAKKKIFVTMNVDEEIVKSLPVTYHNLLETKAASGIKVTRYGYGTKQSFRKLEKRNKNINFIYGGKLNNYQRMLLVDKHRGLFSLNGLVFYTEFNPLITSLVKYVESRYNKKRV